MPRTLTVSGQLTVADDGTVSGTLDVSGGTDSGAPGGQDTLPGTETPDVITDGGGNPTVTDPPAADLPPYAPDVPAGEPPYAGGDPNVPDPASSADPGVADGGPVPDGLGVDPGTDPGAAPVDAGVDGGEAEADPTTAGAEAGDDTGSPAETPAGPPYPGHDLSRDDHQHRSDADVRAWQQAAKDAGYSVGKVDGFFGPRTEAGVIEAQQAALVPTTGVIDAATWALPFADQTA